MFARSPVVRDVSQISEAPVASVAFIIWIMVTNLGAVPGSEFLLVTNLEYLKHLLAIEDLEASLDLTPTTLPHQVSGHGEEIDRLRLNEGVGDEARVLDIHRVGRPKEVQQVCCLISYRCRHPIPPSMCVH